MVLLLGLEGNSSCPGFRLYRIKVLFMMIITSINWASDGMPGTYSIFTFLHVRKVRIISNVKWAFWGHIARNNSSARMFQSLPLTLPFLQLTSVPKTRVIFWRRKAWNNSIFGWVCSSQFSSSYGRVFFCCRQISIWCSLCSGWKG